MKINILIYLTAALANGLVSAAPFEQCPSKAFLIQGSPAQMYGVDLVSAKTTVLAAAMDFASEANNDSVNAVGFN